MSEIPRSRRVRKSNRFRWWLQSKYGIREDVPTFSRRNISNVPPERLQRVYDFRKGMAYSRALGRRSLRKTLGQLELIEDAARGRGIELKEELPPEDIFSIALPLVAPKVLTPKLLHTYDLKALDALSTELLVAQPQDSGLRKNIVNALRLVQREIRRRTL